VQPFSSTFQCFINSVNPSNDAKTNVITKIPWGFWNVKFRGSVSDDISKMCQGLKWKGRYSYFVCRRRRHRTTVINL